MWWTVEIISLRYKVRTDSAIASMCHAEEILQEPAVYTKMKISENEYLCE